MLQNLRDNSKGVIAGILIGFLVIIFAISGSEALFNADTSTKGVVSVNGEDITEAEISRASANYKQQLSARYGDSLPAEYLTDENVRQPVIENLIQRKILVQSAKESGLTIDNDALDQQIVATPQFQKEGGSFDPQIYQQLLRSAGFSPITYKKALIEDAIVNQLTKGVVDSSFVTPAELDHVIALSFQTRDFSYAVIPAKKLRESIIIEDPEIESYYQANTQSFTNPEQVAVDYIDLNVFDLMKKVEVSEEQLRKQYEQNVAAFVAAAERQAAHILIEDNDAQKIAEVSKKLAAGEEFAELAQTYSDDLGSRDQGGDLGFTGGEAFPPKFEAALSALDVGGVSKPIKTDAGTHFIKLISERGTTAPSFEEERSRLTEQLKRNEAENRFIALLEELRERSYNAENLADVAKELGVEHQNTGLFARDTGKDIAAESEFAKAAFSDEVLQQNNSSEVIELAPHRAVVLKKTDYKPSYVKPLEEVKEQITAILLDNKLRDLVAKRGQELEAAVAAGKPLAEAAEANGYELKKVEKVSRSDVSVDREILRQAFDMAKPQDSVPVVMAGTQTTTGDYAVIALTNVTLGGEELPAEQRIAIASQLKRVNSESEYKSYESLLRESADISN